MPFSSFGVPARAAVRVALALSTSACAGAVASAGPVPSAPVAASAASSPEEATERAFAAVSGDSARLYTFLKAMPKGGDLHSHLFGAIYAESFLSWAGEDGLCVVMATLTLVPPPCDAAAGRPPVAEALRGAGMHDRLVDAFSARNYHPATEVGRDRFFAPFARFGAASARRTGDMLAEVAARAAAGQVRYLELMHTAGGGRVAALGSAVGWDDDFGRMRQRLLDAGLADTLAVTLREVDADEARRDALLGCGKPDAGAGCAVTERYLYQVLRAVPREMVFTQILAGFELARRDRRFVGFNLVQAEDDPVAMRDYSLHMRMIAFLRELYPDVPITLHAGELAPGLVPPEGLRFHIREAVGVAGARRVGHGVDILYEEDPDAVLRLMAQRRVLVEINLTSNDSILGVKGARHPLRTFLQYGVPLAITTDDYGVARSSHTLEWLKAVQEHGLEYLTMKRMVRNSIDYAFVDAQTKARLKQGLENAFHQFEQQETAAVPTR